MLHQVTTWFHGIASIPNYGFTEFVEYSKYFKGRSIALWLLFVVRLSVCPCPNPPKYREMLVQLIPWTGRQTDIFQWVGLPVTVSNSRVSGWGDETKEASQHIMRKKTIEKSIISIHADYTSSVRGRHTDLQKGGTRAWCVIEIVLASTTCFHTSSSMMAFRGVSVCAGLARDWLRES